MQQDALEARIVEDQLTDVRTGLFLSMPISTVLSGMILMVELMAGADFKVVAWFAVVNAINGARIAIAITQAKTAGGQAGSRDDLQRAWRQLRPYKILALLSGFAWAFLAILTNGYTAPNSPLHLIILAGVSAGSVTYSGSCAVLPIYFIFPPLLVAAACLAATGGLENYVLAFAVLLFLTGLVRGALIGQARLRETSRLKHEAEQSAAEMERSSREDHLTGLLNRRGMEQAIERFDENDGVLVTMLIDLDGFKSVNDTYGHKVGDELLVKIARRLQARAPHGATLARIGGDEFVVIFRPLDERFAVEEVASQLITEICRPYPEVASIKIGACIGIYLSNQPRLTEMLLRADMALYSAKHRGRNQFCLFDSQLDGKLERRQCIERDIRSAIETGTLKTWFQPIVRLDTEGVVGFEALLRWPHEIHGPIAPNEIVLAARETGMLHTLTEAVFLNCCAMLEALVKADLRELRVAMNISPKELEAGNIDDMMLRGLAARGLPSTMFEVEITEEAPLVRDRVDEKLEHLIDAGISIALDDFGTGFSTLASLKDGRIKKVKIDKSFVLGLSESPKDQLLVKSVIDLGHSLGIEVMAEGVETEADRRILQRLGCTMAQGFLFSKALPLPEAIELAVDKQ